MSEIPDIAAIRAAAQAIQHQVRRTPLIAAEHDKAPLGARVSLKLECLQVSGSFKARGALNTLASLTPAEIARGMITASGGNHGLAVAYSGHVARTPATIYLPESAPKSKAEKLATWGAEVVVEGAVWDDANRAALARAKRDGRTYIHPFADPRVIAGQGTLGLEILEQSPELDTILVPVGGGGLIAGVALAAKAMKPAIRIIGVEPVGAPTLHDSIAAGRVVELARIATAAGTLAPRRSEPINFEIIRAHVARIVLVSDEEMRAAAQWLWFEHGVAAEMSGAAGVAALLSRRYKLEARERACAIVSGAGTDGVTSP